PFYRLTEIVEAMRVVCDRHSDAELVLVGDGLPGDRELIEAAISREGLTGRVEFTGRLEPAAVATELRRAAVWVSVPPSDSFALSLQEAMACGAFPVTTDLRAMREGIDESRGILVSDISPGALGEALSEGLSRAAEGGFAARNHAVIARVGDRTVNLSRYAGMLTRAAEMGGQHDPQ
ncbi:MAG: glycosyltransferase family 4 protein, partial [Coriobacteriia bacterium]|nr:glycosyltransferase family 4 protein [Coriobacteriia bacterium]